jgi:hypothetical protein
MGDLFHKIKPIFPKPPATCKLVFLAALRVRRGGFLSRIGAEPAFRRLCGLAALRDKLFNSRKDAETQRKNSPFFAAARLRSLARRIAGRLILFFLEGDKPAFGRQDWPVRSGGCKVPSGGFATWRLGERLIFYSRIGTETCPPQRTGAKKKLQEIKPPPPILRAAARVSLLLEQI